MEIKNLSVSYGNNQVLNDVSLTIKAGKLTGVLGPNGAGKSTFIKAIMKLIPSDSGTITLNNEKEIISYVPQRQSIDLTFPITVFDMVLMGTYPSLGLFKRPGKKEKEKVIESLESVEMAEFVKRQISELSGGQLQRVVIARALVQEADIYLLDEPFAGVDMVSEGIIMKRIRKLKAAGKTVVIVHHDLTKVREYFDDVILLHPDYTLFGSVDELFTPQSLKKIYGIEIHV